MKLWTHIFPINFLVFYIIYFNSLLCVIYIYTYIYTLNCEHIQMNYKLKLIVTNTLYKKRGMKKGDFLEKSLFLDLF